MLRLPSVHRSVARNRQSVKRVILSSSVAAMEKKKAGPINGSLYTEVPPLRRMLLRLASTASWCLVLRRMRVLQEDWNDEATIDTFPYHLSKKLAEKIAWELSSEYRCAAAEAPAQQRALIALVLRL